MNTYDVCKTELFKEELKEMMLNTFGSDFDAIEELKTVFVNLDFHALLQTVLSNMQTVLTYKVECDKSYATPYRSEPLFECRASRICTIFERGCFSEVSDEYETELWMLEDFTFAVVKIFRIKMTGYQTEFRTCKGFIPDIRTIPCDLEDFTRVLHNFIAKYYDMQTPICEI